MLPSPKTFSQTVNITNNTEHHVALQKTFSQTVNISNKMSKKHFLSRRNLGQYQKESVLQSNGEEEHHQTSATPFNGTWSNGL